MARKKKPWKQPKSAAEGVGSVLAKLELGPRLLDLRVRKAWREAVGESIARRSEATEFERGTLHVTVESPTWKNELLFISKDVIQRVNERFAEDTPGAPKNPVRALKLSVGSVAPPPPKPKPIPPPAPPSLEDAREVEKRVEAITDPDLKDAARRLLLKATRKR